MQKDNRGQNAVSFVFDDARTSRSDTARARLFSKT